MLISHKQLVATTQDRTAKQYKGWCFDNCDLVYLNGIYWVLAIENRRRQWHPTPVLLPGKSHRWRSLVGCSPRGRYKLDSTGRLHFHFSLSCTGEGNGNPLQCSCLENPKDGGAWGAAVYGVAQSWTRLECLSSSIHWEYRMVCAKYENIDLISQFLPLNSPEFSEDKTDDKITMWYGSDLQKVLQ